ncbi:MAG TPA: NUDIX domain-containing protein [Terriglobales bacterium]|nr:NUDIX domain-containing protein [Terriglobales bacterium]
MPSREFPAQPLAGVGVVVVWRDHELRDYVLLVQRRLPPLAGWWSVPGGLIELGETARAAAAREVLEETGLEIDLGPVLTAVDRIETAPGARIRFHYVIVDFIAHPRHDSVAAPVLAAATDAAQARWVRLADLDQYRLTDGLEAVLRLACKIP